MRAFRLLCASSFALVTTNALAAPPNAEAFVVSGIRFGDSFDQVQEVASGLGLRLVRASEYMKRGEYPNSIAYQEFGKPICPDCTQIPRDPRFETLEVQYSRITQRVIAISRTLPFENPVHKDQMERTITERFGKQLSATAGSYAWNKNGQQERKFEMDQHCSVPSLPALKRNPGCKVAALFTFQTARNSPQLVTSQSLFVFDWATYDDEMAIAEQSELNQKAKSVEVSKQREIPRI